MGEGARQTLNAGARYASLGSAEARRWASRAAIMRTAMSNSHARPNIAGHMLRPARG